MTGARIRWGGHATVRIETAGVTLLTDPLLRTRLIALKRRHPVPDRIAVGVDAVLISHMHHDHLDLASLRRLPRSMPVLAPRGSGFLIGRAGLREVTEMRPGDAHRVGGATVVATEALHSGSRSGRGPHGPALGFLVEGAARVYFAGDTDVFPGMADLAPALDCALLPIGGWGPTLGPGHMDPAGAVEALRLLRPRVAVPVHWGTLHPMGLPRRFHGYLREPGPEFARVARESTPEVEVAVLHPGDSVDVPAAG